MNSNSAVQPYKPLSRQHSHAFGQDKRRPGERRTLVVIGITGSMMLVEIAAGLSYGSMALLADGLHMASHAAALVINVFAYIYARRQAHNLHYSFGTGKVNALGGYTGAVLLFVFALFMATESVDRLIHPTEIQFNQAILVAVLGLLVNGVSVFILGEQGHDHERDHDEGAHAHTRTPEPELNSRHGHDHNIRAAYLHILADALTSLLAIFALLAAKYFGLVQIDPLMGIVGAVLVTWWSVGLLRASSAVLLDRQGPEMLRQKIRERIQAVDGCQVTDLHVWEIGPGIYSVILAIAASDPQPPAYYKQMLPAGIDLVHVTVEVNPSGAAARSAFARD